MLKVDNKKVRILLVYDYFYPSILAGGVVISCMNLIQNLHHKYEFFIFTSHRDLDGSELSVVFDKWIDYQGIANIYYGKTFWNAIGYINAIRSISPDKIYINGIYSIVENIFPLLLYRKIWKNSKLIIAPRGMLLKSALSVKPLKKKCYLFFLRFLINHKNIYWHVTSEQEKIELLNYLSEGKSQDIFLVGNVPATNTAFYKRRKNIKVLKLLTVALISPMKNILLVIKALLNFNGPVEYTIVGNVKDAQYWQACLQEISLLPDPVSVTYAGNADHDAISQIMSSHDIYIQPSKSENFSHSIFEALMSGLPVITSHNTPWFVQNNGAGWNVDPDNLRDITDALIDAAQQSTEQYEMMSKQARRLAEDYSLSANLSVGYQKLFS